MKIANPVRVQTLERLGQILEEEFRARFSVSGCEWRSPLSNRALDGLMYTLGPRELIVGLGSNSANALEMLREARSRLRAQLLSFA